MANQDNIRQRIKLKNPRAYELGEQLNKLCVEAGSKGSHVWTDEEMNEDEIEMALFEGYIKEGNSIEEATTKAKNFHTTMRRMFPMD